MIFNYSRGNRYFSPRSPQYTVDISQAEVEEDEARFILKIDYSPNKFYSEVNSVIHEIQCVPKTTVMMFLLELLSFSDF